MPDEKANIYGVPPGADFVATLHALLDQSFDPRTPEQLAKTVVLVPTRRMARRLKALFSKGPARLLPKIGLVTEIGGMFPGIPLVQPVSSLRRLLEIKPIVDRLIEMDGQLPATSSIDLTESLITLLDEFQGEGVSLSALETIVPEDQANHWERNLEFLRAIRHYAEGLAEDAFDPSALLRSQVEKLRTSWSSSPPEHPVFVAGSTGSRATTLHLMETVANQKNGHVVLPGFDFELPEKIWRKLGEGRNYEDHPQFRFANFLNRISVSKSHVSRLETPFQAERNKLISLALRPAPFTDQWLNEGPKLACLENCTNGLSLVEAKSQRQEANTIAAIVRIALSEGKSIAVIAPEATLARRVSAALGEVGITPDDSGGVPAMLSPAGRFARHVARLMISPEDPAEVFALLKHPYTFKGARRGEHMLFTQEFELFVRQNRQVKLDQSVLEKFTTQSNYDTASWSEWLGAALEKTKANPEPLFANWSALLSDLITEYMGPDTEFLAQDGPDDLAVIDILNEFASHSGSTEHFEKGDFLRLFERRLANESVRASIGVRPDVMSWGTLEARVQGADVVVLSGLNEGTWPEQPLPDPWLNRSLRKSLGLLLPERQIGLAAHDFQQAVCAKEVVLTRSVKEGGAEAVPARWVSRLTNLLGGLVDNNGPETLETLRARGNAFVLRAEAHENNWKASQPEPRPSPAPPVTFRPRRYSVTEVKKLIQDPYSIYAKRVLGLTPLDPFSPEPDARLKGIAFHSVLETFYAPETDFSDAYSARNRLLRISEKILEKTVPDLAVRLAWKVHLQGITDWLISSEQARRKEGAIIARERRAFFDLPGTTLSLSGTADRIDLRNNGELMIYDYKSGTLPSKKEIEHFDRQLVLEAMLAENGAFENIPATAVHSVAHISVGRSPSEQITDLAGANTADSVLADLVALLSRSLSEDFGYSARRQMAAVRFAGDYDHLARFGEWKDTDYPKTEALDD